MFPWEELIDDDFEKVAGAGWDTIKSTGNAVKTLTGAIGRYLRYPTIREAYAKASRAKAGERLKELSKELEQAKKMGYEDLHNIPADAPDFVHALGRKLRKIEDAQSSAEQRLKDLAVKKNKLRGEKIGWKDYAAGASIPALALAGAGGMGAGAYHLATRKKQSAAEIEMLAIDLALEKAAEAGWDPYEADERMAALYTLDLDTDLETTKVAYADDLATAVEIRALELLENAGYPIDWNG
jgi:hypothetical protein